MPHQDSRSEWVEAPAGELDARSRRGGAAGGCTGGGAPAHLHAGSLCDALPACRVGAGMSEEERLRAVEASAAAHAAGGPPGPEFFSSPDAPTGTVRSSSTELLDREAEEGFCAVAKAPRGKRPLAQLGQEGKDDGAGGAGPAKRPKVLSWREYRTQRPQETVERVTAYCEEADKAFERRVEVPKELADKRQFCIERIMELASDYSMGGGTIGLAVCYVDKYLAQHWRLPTTNTVICLLPATCFLVACKFQEVLSPLLIDLAALSQDTVPGVTPTVEAIRELERFFLEAIDFEISCISTSHLTHDLLSLAPQHIADQMQVHVSYYSDISYFTCADLPPSLVAMAVLMAAAQRLRLKERDLDFVPEALWERALGEGKAEVRAAMRNIEALNSTIKSWTRESLAPTPAL
mmetsp:Transcript_34670/g.85310  ORF Transcript_34670/g.85310 Transcript_34670/m.85310 type:complete len:407 (-) Transcript_34670:993-2213(-)